MQILIDLYWTHLQAQGQTLEMAGLYIGRDFFSHGQTYVALSRVGHPSCIKVSLYTHLLLMRSCHDRC